MAGAIRRCSNNEKELLWEEGIKRKMTNRIIAASTQLRFGSKRLNVESADHVRLGDFFHSDREEIEDDFLGDMVTEAMPKPPLTLNTIAKCANNRINYWGLIYGKNHKQERMSALEFLIRMHGETPKLFTIAVIVAVWEQMTTDYVDKII